MKKLKRILLAMCALPLYVDAQFTLEGKVTGEYGESVPFAYVSIQNTQLRAVADEDGNFRIADVPGGPLILDVRSVGYKPLSGTINVRGGKRYEVVLQRSPGTLEEVVVDATRIDKGSGMAFSNVDRETLKRQNFGQDAPYMLNLLPSVVVNSDAGNGIGYTGLRIRGSDGTRINVTINGVPVNDAESQGTFFVDMPDLVSSVSNIQVQRGVGASSNGAGAFGASINFKTSELEAKPYANFISTAGSYNTFRNTLAAGSGLLGGKFTVDLRGSIIRSDGYIDRAASDLRSYYAAAGYYGERTVVKYINFRGWETTYQAWNLVPEDSVRKGRRTYNELGLYSDPVDGVTAYPNQNDVYDQSNHQLHVIRHLAKGITLNATAHYTKGQGYYEEFRAEDEYASYGITPPPLLTTSDLVRRRWLDNDFIGGIMNLQARLSQRVMVTAGGGYNSYFGHHIGEVIWARNSPEPVNQRYYHNTSNKNDGNAYVKANFTPAAGLSFFIDLQGRNVDHRLHGIADSLGEMRRMTFSYFFYNPKMGISYDLGHALNLYASVAHAHKEPNRNDFVNSGPRSRPKPEQLTDFEGGVRYAGKRVYGVVNLFHMDYKDQLVLNGQINDVGAYNRVNVPESFRRGIEVEATVAASRLVDIGGNITFSDNRIRNYREYIDSGDVQAQRNYANTHIAFSPSVVASAVVTLKPLKGLEIGFIAKHVGRQFLDNTSQVSRSIDPYTVWDTRVNYRIPLKSGGELNFMFILNNIFGKLYETNGYTYSYYYGPDLYTHNYLAPAAPGNVMGGINVRF